MIATSGRRRVRLFASASALLMALMAWFAQPASARPSAPPVVSMDNVCTTELGAYQGNEAVLLPDSQHRMTGDGFVCTFAQHNSSGGFSAVTVGIGGAMSVNQLFPATVRDPDRPVWYESGPVRLRPVNIHHKDVPIDLVHACGLQHPGTTPVYFSPYSGANVLCATVVPTSDALGPQQAIFGFTSDVIDFNAYCKAVVGRKSTAVNRDDMSPVGWVCK